MIYIYDASAIIFSGARAARSKYWNNMGFPTGGLYKFLSFMFRDLKSIDKRGGSIIVALDSDKTYNRKKAYPKYKANRQSTGQFAEEEREVIHLQLRVLQEMLPRIGIPTVQIDGLEADDIIYSLVNDLGQDNQILIRADDSDLMDTKLLGKNVTIESVTGRGTLNGCHTIISKILNGDPTDNYDGIQLPILKEFLKKEYETNKDFIFSQALPPKAIFPENITEADIQIMYRNLYLARPMIVKVYKGNPPKVEINYDNLELYLNALACKSFLERNLGKQRDYTSQNVVDLTADLVGRVPENVKKYLNRDTGSYWKRNKTVDLKNANISSGKSMWEKDPTDSSLDKYVNEIETDDFEMQESLRTIQSLLGED